MWAALNGALMLAIASFLVRLLFPNSAGFPVVHVITSAILVAMGAYIVVTTLLDCLGVLSLGNILKMSLTR
jgi:hypothetical protein